MTLLILLAQRENHFKLFSLQVWKCNPHISVYVYNVETALCPKMFNMVGVKINFIWEGNVSNYY